MFDDVVEKLRHSYQERQKYFVTPLDAEEPGEIAAVDGGAAILWSNTVQSIGVVTAGYLIYNKDHEITHSRMYRKEVLFSGTDIIDLNRFSLELSCLAEAATICNCVLYDGALQDIPQTEFKSTLESIDRNVTVIGISKKTRMDTLQKGVSDTETLDYPGKWYYKIPEHLSKSYKSLGDVFVARLHERGPSFRLDVRGTPLFGLLVHFSKYLFCLGYPYPLLEIHKATTLRDKKEYYQSELQKAMSFSGLEDEYLSGIYHLEREREEFHQVLDGLV